MDEVEVSTLVYLPPEDIYEFLVDFPRYTRYTEHLEEVRRQGDGGPGTRYYLRFAWWKLSYTAHSEVTDVDPPTRIDWQIVKDIDANGFWAVEPVPEAAPADEDHACRVRLHINFRASSADSDSLGLPRFVSFDWVVGKVKPRIMGEAKRVVERMVADLEGTRREVDLTVHTGPDTL